MQVNVKEINVIKPKVDYPDSLGTKKCIVRNTKCSTRYISINLSDFTTLIIKAKKQTGCIYSEFTRKGINKITGTIKSIDINSYNVLGTGFRVPITITTNRGEFVYYLTREFEPGSRPAPLNIVLELKDNTDKF